MNPSEINRAIAEYCGWRQHVDFKDIWYAPNGTQLTTTAWVPDYYTDLNACREMECKLPATERDIYLQWLARIVDRERRMATINWLTVNAKAPQRCEAFLRTGGKWIKEGGSK